MNLTFSQEDLEFKEEVKDFINKNLDKTTQKKINGGHHLSKDDLVNWQKKLYEKGWMAPNWPKEYGGTGWSITQRYIFDEECGAAAAPSALPFGVTMVAPVIIKFGTDKQKEKYDTDHGFWLKFSLTTSTLLILVYFIFPSQLIEIVSRINII